MNKIRPYFLQKQSKSLRDEVVKLIIKDHDLLSDLMYCYFDENRRINQYASWCVGIIGEKEPNLLLPYLEKIISTLGKEVHDGYIRNTIRILQFINIPEELEGIVYDECFSYLNDPKTAVAIRAFCMTVLSNIAMKYPELKEELIKTIELYYPQGSGGYQSRARREIKRLLK